METIDIVEVILLVITLVISIISLLWTMKTKRRYERLAMNLGKGKDITEILKKYIEKVNEINKRDDQIIEFCQKINDDSVKAISKIGIVKYDAYNNTKNKLSFAVALLNRENSGIIINSIYSVDGSNVFSKSVNGGKSSSTLSAEESEALRRAIENKKEY